MRQTRQSKLSEGKSVPINVQLVRQNETPKALINDAVLQNIFKYLSYKDLKSCREVGNKTWLKSSKKAWWSKIKVVFSKYDWLRGKYTDYLSQKVITSNATNYRFEHIEINPDDPEDSKNFKEFWDKMGHSIKHLELFYVSFPTVTIFRSIIYKKCPNLEKLVIENFSIIEYDGFDEPLEFQKPRFGENKNLKFLKFVLVNNKRPPDMPVSWMELLSHLPNLQSLEVCAHYEEVYKTIAIIRQHDAKMLKLNHIDILSQVNDDYEQSLRSVLLDPNLSLETIRMKAENCQSESVAELLELHAKSLQEFQIYQGFNFAGTLSIRRPLQNLETLDIEGIPFTVGIFNYTPNLRKVKLNYDGSDFQLSEKADPNLKISTCKELTLNKYAFTLGDESNSHLTFFLNLFPNVEILRTSKINNLKFSMICARWTKLVSFKIYDSEVDVVGLLGFDPDSKAKDMTLSPNITNLKDLKSFSMRAGNRLEMKNGGVILKALKGLHQLKTFELNQYELKEDQKVWKKISDKYQPVEDEDSDSD